MLLLFICLLPVSLIYFLIYNHEEESVETDGEPMLEISFYSKSERRQWKTIRLGAFSIEMPKDYIYYSYKGIDSYVGELRGQTGSYSFDYGWYSNSLEDYHSTSDFYVSIDTLQGKFARVVLSDKSSTNGIFIRNIRGESSLCFFGSGMTREEAKYAFKSINFSIEGITSINFGDNTVRGDLQESLFSLNCSPCHAYNDIYVSKKSLRDMSKLDTSHLYNWIIKPNEILQNDSTYLEMVRFTKFNHNHSFFKKSELERLINYIKSFDN